MAIDFKIEKEIKNGLGRAGVLETPHGIIETPAFVAVGTKATVKSLTPEQIKETGSQIVLANTYHLYLQPGEKIIKEAGGLHKFMNWSGPTMTDSGGFQAFSLGVAYGEGIGKFIGALAPQKLRTSDVDSLAKVTEEGVEFKSVIDGSTHFFTPEKSIQIQNDIGADIIFALDECTSPRADHGYLREAMEMTHRWAERCLIEHTSPLTSLLDTGGRKKQALFGIVQGGRSEELRKESAKEISKLGFDGFGIGGSFVKEDMATAVRWVNEILPRELPRHLLGVGEPIDLILAVENGCDTFDCVAPTRMARNGALYTSRGKINITNSKFKNQTSKFDPDCNCYTCNNYTAAYLSHLFRAKEMLAATLSSIHNLYFINTLVSNIRNSILEDRFPEFKTSFLQNYK